MIFSLDKPTFNYNMSTQIETATETVTKTEEAKTEKELIIRYPLFIMFAEYWGYVSPLIEWAEELCNGNSIPKYQQNILKVDARSIYHQMLKDCSKEIIVESFWDYYDVLLNEYDKALEKFEKKNEEKEDDLPF